MAATKTKKSGRTYGAKAFTQAEDDVIRRSIQTKIPMSEVARLLGRCRAAVYARRAKVAAQLVLDLGQGADNASAGE